MAAGEDNRLVVRVPDVLKDIVYQECWATNTSYQDFLRQMIVDFFFKKYGANPITNPIEVMESVRKMRESLKDF